MGIAPRIAWRFVILAMVAALASAQVPLTISPTSVPLAGVGQAYSTFFFTSGSNQTVSFTLGSGALPPGLTLSRNGVISGTPTAPGIYPFRLQATSPQPASGFADLSITVVGFNTPDNLGSTDAGKVFSRVLSLNVPSDGVTWQFAAGDPPPGLGLTASGGLTGVPALPGTYSFTVLATVPNIFDAPVTATRTFQLTVTGIAPLTFATTALPLAAVNVPFSFQLRASGGTGVYSWTQLLAPPGLSISASGVLSGTPTQVGTLPVAIRITSGPDTIEELIFMGVIDVFNDSTLPDAEVAVPYEVPIRLTFGIPTWSLVAGTPPPGLTFDTMTGNLSGTPTATGNYTFTVQATTVNDGGTTVVRKQLNIRVKPTAPVEVIGIPLPFGAVGKDYSATLSATGGNGTFVWSATVMPPGLMMGANGVISGRPTAGGVFTVQATATSVGSSGFASLPLIVVQIESPTELPEVRSGAPYSTRLEVTAGAATWSIVSGRLPAGITLAPQGFLLGTSTEAGRLSFRVRALVDTGTVAPAIVLEKDFTISVGGPPLSLMTGSLAVGQINGLYGQRLEAAGGDPPYRFSATGTPPGITVEGDTLTGIPTEFGTYPVMITARDSKGAQTTGVLMLEVTPTGPLGALLRISQRVLRITVPEGGEVSRRQILTAISSNSEPVSFTVNAAGAPWLMLESDSGQTPRTLAVRASSAGLKAGEYTGAVRFATDGQAPLEVTVILTVTPAIASLDASPAQVRFATRVDGPATLERLLVISNAGGGGALEFQATPVAGAPWLRILGDNTPRVVNGGPTYVRIQVAPRGLAPGIYRDVLRLTSRAGNRDVPVTLAVAGTGAGLEVSERGVLLAARQGDTPPAHTIWVRNVGGEGTSIEWKAEVVRGADAFALTPAKGIVVPGTPGGLTIRLKPEVAAKVGTASALIRISDAAGKLTPRYVVATSDIGRVLGVPAPQLEPAGLLFQGAAHGTPPAAQTVTLSLADAEGVSFAAGATVDEVDNWLTVAPAMGQVGAGASVELRVTAAPGRLSPGMHTGSVHVSVGGELRTVRVSFAVGPDVTAAGGAGSTGTTSPSCAATHAVLAQTATPGNFSVVAGAPTPLEAQVVDNCGVALADASVAARFSNGDAPLALESTGTKGFYTATWQPGVADSQTVITLEAAAAGLIPGKLEVIGAVVGSAVPLPRISAGGILNNLSGERGLAFAPGTVIQMFGDSLAPYISRAAEAPLPTQALGIEVILGTLTGEVDAPLYYLSPRQLTVQLPTEMVPNATYSSVVAARDGFALPELIDVVPVRAAAATITGMLVATHADGSVVGGTATPNNVFGATAAPSGARPARPGEEVAIYLVGMGSTSPLVASGKAAPKSPLAMVIDLATVQVDGAPAEVTFQGLAPGQVGLYQMNFRVPDGARAGELDVKIWQGDVEVQSGKLTVERP